MVAATHAADIGLGIQIGVSSIIVIAADGEGSIEHTRVVEGDFAQMPAPEALAIAGDLARQAIADCSVKHHINGVGLAVPGLVNRADGYLEVAANLHWATMFPAADLGFSDSTVTVENSAKLGALAEAHISGEPSFIYLTLGDGIGGAIVDDGRLFRGERGWDGEIGHMTVDPRGPLCECGATGCLEQYASKPALFRAAGLSPDALVSDFLALLDKNDDDALTALDAAIMAIAQVLANVITLIDIRHLVIDGELSPLMPFITGGITQLVDERVIAGHKVPLTSRVAMAGEFGPALGGALLAQSGY